MSVLFIGDRSPYLSPQLHPHLLDGHQRRMRQEQYRFDLLRQIQDKRQRNLRQKEAESAFDRQYERYLYRGHAPTIFSTPKRDISDRSGHFASGFGRVVTEQSEDQHRTPIIFKERKSIFTPSAFDLPQLHSKPPPSRLRTEDYQQTAFQQFVESYGKREQQLREYEDRRFEQVYEKMYNSVDSLSNTEEECELIRSRFKPIHLNLQTRPRHVQNPENDLYRLPPIVKLSRKQSRQRQRGRERERERGMPEMNWREWYAREKLRELQEYYQRALIDDQSRERVQNDDSRAATPSFAQRRM